MGRHPYAADPVGSPTSGSKFGFRRSSCFSIRRCNRTWFLLLFLGGGWGGWVGGVGGGGWIRTSFILHACPKHWYLQRFRLFVQHTAQGCGRRKSVTSVQPFATMPNTRPTKTVKVLKFGKCVFGNASLQKNSCRGCLGRNA